MRRYYLISFLATFFLLISMTTVFAEGESVIYCSHVQDIGWQQAVPDGWISGTTGERRKVEAVRIALQNAPEGLHVEYSPHIQDIGWVDYSSDGADAGTTGENRGIEALKIRLTGEASPNYNIYYRTHVSGFGWLGWTNNDQISGSTGYGRSIEALQIIITPQGIGAPGFTGNPSIEKEKRAAGDTGLNDTTGLELQSYCSEIAWTNPIMNSGIIGTVGQGLPIEIIRLSIKNLSGQIQYNTYLNGAGWQTPVCDGQLSGMCDSHIHLEGVQLKLAGDIDGQYDIYYRAHVSKIGWLGWTSNGAPAGTKDANCAIEAIEVRLVPKGDPAPGDTNNSYLDYSTYYYTHPKLQAIPGLRTVQNFLATAMMPIGQTNYVLGGGRTSEHVLIGPGSTTIGLVPQWKAFFDSQNHTYDYTNHYFETMNGLDCIGFVGWTTYNTLNTQSGGPGETYWSQDQPRVFAEKGYGTYYPYGSVTSFAPGDVISLGYEGHVYIVIGTCNDGSVVLAHASPPGVMLSGTTPKIGIQTDATRLAKKFMRRYYPEYYNRYNNQMDREARNYTQRVAKFSWGSNFVGDPDNIRSKNAAQVLAILFDDKA